MRRFAMISLIAPLALASVAASATELLVPAYFYPSWDPAQSQWDEMQAALSTGAHITAIVNMTNGPGNAPNSDYASAINAFRAAGGKVLGYVYTCYGSNQCSAEVLTTRTPTEVLADAQRYAQWYGVDGIFLDEMASDASALPFYTTVAQGLRAAHPGWQIVGNPGTAPDAAYLGVADTLVTFENGASSYGGYTAPTWGAAQAASRQAHLLYNVGGASTMLNLLAQAQARNVGYVYITDDVYTPGSATATNPWDTLPSYWMAEAQAVATVPEPDSGALYATGLLALAIGSRLKGRAA